MGLVSYRYSIYKILVIQVPSAARAQTRLCLLYEPSAARSALGPTEELRVQSAAHACIQFVTFLVVLQHCNVHFQGINS